MWNQPTSLHPIDYNRQQSFLFCLSLLFLPLSLWQDEGKGVGVCIEYLPRPVLSVCVCVCVFVWLVFLYVSTIVILHDYSLLCHVSVQEKNYISQLFWDLDSDEKRYWGSTRNCYWAIVLYVLPVSMLYSIWVNYNYGYRNVLDCTCLL
jgi:hypothetical protein